MNDYINNHGEKVVKEVFNAEFKASINPQKNNKVMNS